MRFRLFFAFVVIIIVGSLFDIYFTPLSDSCNQSQRRGISGVYACVNYSSIFVSFIRRPGYYLKLVNNTDYSILPAQDRLMSNWLLLRKTGMGWQKLDVYLGGNAIELTQNIDSPLASNQTEVYRLVTISLGKHASEAVLSPDTGLEISNVLSPLSKGEYMLQIEYMQLQPTNTITLTTYTNLIPYKSSTSTSVLVKISPITDDHQHYLVGFVISNRSDNDIWLRPLSWMATDFFYSEDNIIVTRQVDNNSWESLHWHWPITKNSPEPIWIEAGQSVEVVASDLDTEIPLTEPGIYRWIIPIYLEYLPQANQPRLNQVRYIFSENLEIK